MQKDFEQMPHTADLKIRVYGKTQKDLFRHALMGMFQVIKPKAPFCFYQNDRLVCPRLPENHKVNLQSENMGYLLIDFLSEALYLSDVYNEAYLDANIEYLDDHSLKAVIKGIKITGFEVVEIKAVTYHDLEIKKLDDYWQVDIVFDI